MKKKLCKCKTNPSVHSVDTMWGYYLQCDECDGMIEDSFEYYGNENSYD